MVSGALVLCLMAFAMIATLTAFRGDDRSNAAAMPTACENLVEATKVLAERGSAAGAAGSTDPFSTDASSRGAQTLQNLLDACDAELAMMSR